MMSVESHKFETIHRTAEKYKLPEGTLRRYLKEDRLPGRFEGRRYMVDVEQLLEMIRNQKVPVRVSVAAGIFSDINNPRFTDREKEESVMIVTEARDFASVKRDAMKEVIVWLMNRLEKERMEHDD